QSIERRSIKACPTVAVVGVELISVELPALVARERVESLDLLVDRLLLGLAVGRDPCVGHDRCHPAPPLARRGAYSAAAVGHAATATRRRWSRPTCGGRAAPVGCAAWASLPERCAGTGPRAGFTSHLGGDTVGRRC